METQNTKPKGAILTFLILQLCYLFFFFATFPDSFRTALREHDNGLQTAAAWLATITMLIYCIISLVSITQLVLHRHGFLRMFQIAGAVAMLGNFSVYVLRQLSDSLFSEYYYSSAGDYNWVLFILALFWTIIWCMYFARSSRVYSYMGQDASYLHSALFMKKVKEPTPWQEPQPAPYPYAPTPPAYPAPVQDPYAPVYPAPQQGAPVPQPPAAPQQQGPPPGTGYESQPPIPGAGYENQPPPAGYPPAGGSPL